MTFIETIPDGEATGQMAEFYESDRDAEGRVPNFVQALSPAPEIYAAPRPSQPRATIVDGLGTQPDAHYAGFEPALRDRLEIGRPIAT